MSLWVWIGVALLGGVGAVVRFVLDTVISARADGDLPLGTLTVNLSGAFVLGLLTGLNLVGNTLLLAGTATIGAYTTFSTWMLETHRLAEDRAHRIAVLNIVLSLAAGIGAAALGRVI
ncbi:MAG: fluoride efflux transporter CrcB [Solirubrobacteraceae bacterium]